MVRSGKQKLRFWRSSGRSWRGTFGFPEKKSGKSLENSARKKVIMLDNGRNTLEKVLNLTVMPSVEEAELEDSFL